MADKRCENGHFIDESWDICPYCPPDKQTVEPVVRPRPAEPERPSRADRPERAERPERAPRDPVSEGFIPPRTIASVKPEAAAAAANRYVVGWLVGLSGSSRGESFTIRNGRNIVGRDKRSDIVVNDEQASSHHADLVYRPEERRFILMDHNSTNGTYVNEVEIEPRRTLDENDVIRIGSQRFLFVPLCHDGLYWEGEGQLR